MKRFHITYFLPESPEHDQPTLTGVTVEANSMISALTIALEEKGIELLTIKYIIEL